MTSTPAPVRHERHHRDVRNAWISLAFFPVAVLVVMVLGDWLLSLAGYDSADPDIPGRVRLLVGGPMVLVAIVPSLLGVWFGQRARKAGDGRGLAPVVVGLTLSAVFVLQNLLGVFLG